MIQPEVKKICKDIRELKVQGARNVAIAAVKALNIQAKKSKAKKSGGLLSEMLEAADALAGARPTEPLLRNSIRNALKYVFYKMKKDRKRSVAELKKRMANEEKEYLKTMERNMGAISEYGAKEIPAGATVLTHCHSSTVTKLLIRAHGLGKDIKVINTETRPKFQGRITSRELADAGIDVTMIVDSAVETMMQDVDLVIVGADAVTSIGDLVNKIGTAGIARLAHDHDLKFFCASELYKYDPMTLWGNAEEIEMRDPEEIANPREFPGVKIINPAFDLTQAKFISGYITEKGIVPPQAMMALAMKELDVESVL